MVYRGLSVNEGGALVIRKTTVLNPMTQTDQSKGIRIIEYDKIIISLIISYSSELIKLLLFGS